MILVHHVEEACSRLRVGVGSMRFIRGNEKEYLRDTIGVSRYITNLEYRDMQTGNTAAYNSVIDEMVDDLEDQICVYVLGIPRIDILNFVQSHIETLHSNHRKGVYFVVTIDSSRPLRYLNGWVRRL